MICHFCKKKAEYLIHVVDLNMKVNPYAHPFYYLCDKHFSSIFRRIYNTYKRKIKDMKI